MNRSSEKRDSLTDASYDTKDLGVDIRATEPVDVSRRTHIDTTLPQSYYLKKTRTYWVFEGAYSLRSSVDDPSTEAWNVKTSSKALKIFRPNGSLVGTAGLHKWSSKVDIAMNDVESIPRFELKEKGLFRLTAVHVFQLHGREFTWKRATKLSPKFQLVDEAGNALAWIGNTSWKGRYKFKLIRPGMELAAVEAILISGLAIIENEKRMQKAAAIASTNRTALLVPVS